MPGRGGPAVCFGQTRKRLHLERLVSDPVRVVAVQLPHHHIVICASWKLAEFCGYPRHKMVFADLTGVAVLC